MSKRPALRLEADVAHELVALSESSDRTPSEIVNASLRAHFAHERAFVRSISQGAAQLDAGQGMSTRTLRQRLAAARAARR